MGFTESDVCNTAIHIWRTALGLELTPSEEAFRLDSVERMIGSIHFEGGFEGQVALECSKELAVKMAALMFAVDEDQLSDEDVIDAVHELTNITGGRLKALTPRSTKMSIPVLIDVDQWQNLPPGTHNRMGFICDGQQLNICVTGNVVDTDRESIDVLLIEDSRVARRMILGSLDEVKTHRFDVDWCETLADGISKIKEHEFDVVLLDLTLPDSNGVDTCVTVRKQFPDLPIVAVTSADDESIARETLKAGAQDFLLKAEVAPNLLARSIHYAIDRSRAERDHQELQHQLLEASRQAGIAEMATGVLHNVGNVLNSVNLSATLIGNLVNSTWNERLQWTSNLVSEHQENLASFVAEDDRGKRLPLMLERLSIKLTEERESLKEEVAELIANVTHIKEIVSAQQAMAKPSGLQVQIDLKDLMEKALKTRHDPLKMLGIEVVEEFGETPTIWTDQHKILQILTNLIKNAEESIGEAGNDVKRLTLRTGTLEDQMVFAEVVDSGLGIDKDNINKLFQHGFTTKKDGHGFGLHSSANAASELNGKLTASSEGVGLGATFRLALPFNPSVEKASQNEQVSVG